MAHDTTLTYRNRRLGDTALVISAALAETSGTTVVDDSSNGIDGSYAGGGSVTLNQAGIGDEWGAVQLANMGNKVIDFTAAKTAITAACSGNEWSLGGWFFGIDTSAPSERRAVFRLNNLPAAGEIHVNFRCNNTDGSLFWLVNIDNGAFSQTYTDASFDFDGWHHFLMVVSEAENRVTLYIDGAEVAEWANSTDLATLDFGDRFHVGGRSATQEEWNGRIAHVRLYNRPLSDAEALEEYQYNQNPIFTGTIGGQTDPEDEAIDTLDVSGFWSDNNAADVLTFSDGGTLPTGLSINASSGEITGTPTTPDTYNVTITATDNGNPNLATVSNTFSWVVEAAGTEYMQSAGGSITPTGAVAKLVSLSPDGALTPAGAAAKQVQVSPDGALTPAGAQSRVIGKVAAGVLAPAGQAVKQAAKTLAGSITPTGALDAVKTALQAAAGALTPTGTLARTVIKAVAGAVAPAGSISRAAGKVIAGVLTPAGSPAKQTAKAFSGSLTPAGTADGDKTVQAAVAGQITPSGALSKQVNKVNAGSITPTGGISNRVVAVSLAGGLAPTGSLSRVTATTLGGVLLAGGTLNTSTEIITPPASRTVAVSAQVRSSAGDEARTVVITAEGRG